MNLKNLLYRICRTLVIITISNMLIACQKPVPDEIREETQKLEKQQSSTPDLNVICTRLQDEMKMISAQRTTFALQQINQNIRLCLPLISFDEQKELMSLSDQMYEQFLKIDRTAAQQKAFDLYAHDQSQFPTIQQNNFEKLHIRDQYLLRHKGQAYIDLIETTHNTSTYKRNAYYLSKVFAPYFPEAEKNFMQTMALHNQTPIFKNNSLIITPEEVSLRAQMWENYVKSYPNSSFKKDAQYLLQVYTSLLFIGSKDSPVSYDFESLNDIQISSLNQIELLSQNKNSHLAEQARLFLKFISLNPNQRNALLADHSNAAGSDDPIEQIKQHLNLKNFNFSRPLKRDCFSDAICYDIE